MRKIYIVFLLSLCAVIGQSQTAQDLFRKDSPVTWLGIDFSHVRLIGNFSEFYEFGEKSNVQIITSYFPKWNHIIFEESDKYDIRGMLRRMDIDYDIEMVMDRNYRTDPDSLESYNTRRFSDADIQSFVNQYNLAGRDGIGVVFIAECLNKCYKEAFYHFVAINMKSGEVIFHKRLRGEPSGIGLRNYWANSLYKVINDIKCYYYNNWKENLSRGESETVQVTL
jgi:hypothetical protein